MLTEIAAVRSKNEFLEVPIRELKYSNGSFDTAENVVCCRQDSHRSNSDKVYYSIHESRSCGFIDLLDYLDRRRTEKKYPGRLFAELLTTQLVKQGANNFLHKMADDKE
jgi:hypothetical protein